MEIYLVRHTALDIGPGICYGQSDIPLPEGFEQQAKKVLEALPDGADAVYSSPLTRCTRLASLLPCCVPVQRDPRLLELNFGEWEMKKWETISLHEPWFADYIHASVPGGESYWQLYVRVNAFLSDLEQSRRQRVVAVTHGGVIKAAIAAIRRITLNESIRIPVPFGSVHRFILTKEI